MGQGARAPLSEGSRYYANMQDVQRAPVSKRLFAFLADVILAGLLATGLFLVLSTVFKTDSYSEKYERIKAEYEQRYGVTFGLTDEEYNALSKDAQQNYANAVDAMNGDAEANKAIRTAYGLTLATLAGGILIAMLVLEFVVPLIAKDGRTPGKLLFGLGVMRSGRIRLSGPVLFVRGIVGKCLFELILPVSILYSVFTGITGPFGLVLLGIFVVAEIFALVRSRGSSMLHDVLADTVFVDWASQRIFPNAEARDAYDRENQREADEYRVYD